MHRAHILMKFYANEGLPLKSYEFDLQLNFYHPLCYNSTALCPLLQCLLTTSAILAGAHSYFVVSSFKCERKNSCHNLIPYSCIPIFVLIFWIILICALKYKTGNIVYMRLFRLPWLQASCRKNRKLYYLLVMVLAILSRKEAQFSYSTQLQLFLSGLIYW